MWFGNYLQENKRLKVIKEDVRNADNIRMQNIDVVIHLANIANDPCSELDSKLNWEVNTLSTMRLVERAIKDNVKQFMYASSGSVYGIKNEPEVTEDLSLFPISDYNKTKMISERVLLSYKDKIKIQIIRPATVCGYSHRLRLDLTVNMLTMQAIANKKITVFGGKQTRPNINIKDMVGIYLHFLTIGKDCTGIYNAGFENLSLSEIAERIISFAPAEIVTTESNDPRSYRLSSKKLLSTGFTPQYGIDDAIKEIIEQYRNGNLKNEEKWYNIKCMKKMKLQ
jgi:nucleoside-diphosphate-sugar epimerase